MIPEDTVKDCYSLLHRHQQTLSSCSLQHLFDNNQQRVNQLSTTLGDFYFDFSKNHMTTETIQLLEQFAKTRQLPQAIQALFSGERVNTSENRPALHTALRFQGMPSGNIEQLVDDTRRKMAIFVEKIHTQQWHGFSKKPIEAVVNMGIGGSDLGPKMVIQALSGYQKHIDVTCVANIDGAHLCDSLSKLNPETTLFIIASKSFSTLETLENTRSARQWLLDHGCPESGLKHHFVAISANIAAVHASGMIDKENVFPLWDWVGGRYSLWSAVGLSIAIAIGMENFNRLLVGAHQMDEHYRSTALSQNLPVIAGLLTFWYGQFWGARTHAILPYAQRLCHLPSYLQQLDMESLGKSVSCTGSHVTYPTGSVIWGAEGTNGQHSFHQLLHQGTELIPVDFIAIKQPMSALHRQHQQLLACCISQSQALLKGKTLVDARKELSRQGLSEDAIQALAPHKVVVGNKPSNTIILKALNPENLGLLLAFYEHKVHTLGVLLNINPFDQWGVELGKQLGVPIFHALSGKNCDEQWDESTLTLIKKLSG